MIMEKTQVEEIKSKGLDLEWRMIVPANIINRLLDKKYTELSKNIRIPGFRPGKVPIEVVRKRHSQTVVSETLDNLINEKMRESLLERKIRPAVQPNVEIKSFEEGKDLTVEVKIQKMPEIEPVNFEKISLEKSVLNVTKKDIDNTLKDIAKKHERFQPLKKKRKSKLGDLILFDYEGKINGKEFSNSKGKDETVVLGSKKYIPGYEEQMVNLSISDSKDIDVTFPEDYREKKLAGKKAIFSLIIKDIQEPVDSVPIDDQLAKEVGEENLALLTKKIEERMLKDFKTLSDLKMRRQAVENLLESSSFELPSKMLDEEFNFLKSQSTDKKEKEIKDLSKRRVKLGLIISSISEKNKINVEDADLTKAVVNEANKYPGQEKEVVEFYKKNPAMMNNLRGVALEEKVMTFVVNSCKKNEKQCTMDELFKSDFLKDEKKLIKKGETK